MSHLLEEYAKNLGVKLSKPMVSKHFWPLKHEKFITISLESQIPSKDYKYYEVVINMILNHLANKGIKIIQIGDGKSEKLPNVHERIMDIPFKNNAYIISKSMLHIGVDNVFSHYASSIGVPLVTLFGNVYSSISKGYWSKNQINIEAPWKVKPSFASSDINDAINQIPPEDIANAIFKQLGFQSTVTLKSKFFGGQYHKKVIEIVPNFFNPIEDFKSRHIFLRVDYGFEADSLAHWFNYLNSFGVFSKKLLPIETCQRLKGKLKQVFFIADESTALNEDYLLALRENEIAITILVEDESLLPKMRDRFFDFDVHLYPKGDKKMLEEKNIDYSKAIFDSSKIIFSNNKRYASKYHLLKDQNFVDKNLNLEENDVLLEELNHFYIYERTN